MSILGASIWLRLSFDSYFADKGILQSSSPMKVLALIDDANAVCCRYWIEGFEQAMARAKPTRPI
jgi:hypothetical protein